MGTYYLSVLSRIDATVDIRGERMEMNRLGKGLGICEGKYAQGRKYCGVFQLISVYFNYSIALTIIS